MGEFTHQAIIYSRSARDIFEVNTSHCSVLNSVRKVPWEVLNTFLRNRKMVASGVFIVRIVLFCR